MKMTSHHDTRMHQYFFSIGAVITLFAMIILISIPALPLITVLTGVIVGTLLIGIFSLKYWQRLACHHPPLSHDESVREAMQPNMSSTANMTQNLNPDITDRSHHLEEPLIDSDLTKSPFQHEAAADSPPASLFFADEGLGPNGDNILGL